MFRNLRGMYQVQHGQNMMSNAAMQGCRRMKRRTNVLVQMIYTRISKCSFLQTFCESAAT